MSWFPLFQSPGMASCLPGMITDEHNPLRGDYEGGMGSLWSVRVDFSGSPSPQGRLPGVQGAGPSSFWGPVNTGCFGKEADVFLA